MSPLLSGLYIVSTPIGNLDDMTFRALEVIKNSDIILCEDTRRSLKLLQHFNIKKKLIPYHKFNEKKEVNKIIKYINEGKILSLISDAGTPVISDPGLLLIKECVKQNINVSPIPGVSSIVAAMSVAGFSDKFIFYGFLPKAEKELNKVLLQFKDLDFSIVFFIPANKINFYLKIFKIFFEDRDIMIAREMTKIYESFYRGSLSSMKMFEKSLKGELTIVISEKYNKKTISINNDEIKKQAMIYLKKYSLKDTADLISKTEKISRKLAYEICLKLKKNEKNN
tara:strand:- start:201 stop:1046 length:846 start_codon:yes stop_codon:yes gene_type:complete